MVVWSDQVDRFKSIFEEGKIYIIYNFNVRPLKETSFKCIPNGNQIWLSKHTTVDKVRDDDDLIALQKFDFIDIEEIPVLFGQSNFRNQLIGNYVL